MVNKFKLTVVRVHAQTRWRSVHVRGVTAEQKPVENQDWAAGRLAVASRGPPGRGNLYLCDTGAVLL